MLNSFKTVELPLLTAFWLSSEVNAFFLLLGDDHDERIDPTSYIIWETGSRAAPPYYTRDTKCWFASEIWHRSRYADAQTAFCGQKNVPRRFSYWPSDEVFFWNLHVVGNVYFFPTGVSNSKNVLLAVFISWKNRTPTVWRSLRPMWVDFRRTCRVALWLLSYSPIGSMNKFFPSEEKALTNIAPSPNTYSSNSSRIQPFLFEQLCRGSALNRRQQSDSSCFVLRSSCRRNFLWRTVCSILSRAIFGVNFQDYVLGSNVKIPIVLCRQKAYSRNFSSPWRFR